ncbi:MAG: hypothetical protein KME50_29195 [Nostoc desertorum CM1-VF14]|nr:hypothetical protein [Nostoc desertorum CM1-VF14]
MSRFHKLAFYILAIASLFVIASTYYLFNEKLTIFMAMLGVNVAMAWLV